MIKEISSHYLSIFRQTDEIKYSKKSGGARETGYWDILN